MNTNQEIYLAALLDIKGRFSLTKQLVKGTTYYRPLLVVKGPPVLLSTYQQLLGGILKSNIWTSSGSNIYHILVPTLPHMQVQVPIATLLKEASEWFLLPRGRRYIKVATDTITFQRKGKKCQKKVAIREITPAYQGAMETIREQISLLQ